MILGRLSLAPMTRARLLFFVLLGCCAVSALLVFGVRAASPPSGTLTDVSPAVTYTSGPFFVPNASAQSGSAICNTALQCDDFALTIAVAGVDSTTKQVRAQIAWPNSTADFDLYVLDSMSNTVATSASSADPETVILPAVSGTYILRAVPFNPLGQSITGTVSLENKPQAPPVGSGIAPRYQNYPAPNGLGTSSGEPSLGVNWNTEINGNGGTVMYEAVLQTLRVTFDITCTGALWQDVSSPYTSIESLDPILFTDHTTGRTFVSQLTGQDSASAYTDDNGNTYTPSQGGGLPSGVDHQTIGAGPYSSVGIVPPAHVYTDAVYYCSQDVATAFCARSDNGGLTYGAGVPIYNINQCTGIHGHVKVAPDGTVYVPNRSCGSGQGVAVSDGNNTTNANGNGWVVRTVPNSMPGDTDPSIGIATDGTVYMGWQDGGNNSHPKIAVSHDRGQTWSTPYDVGAQFGINNVVFPEVVAGDPNRAAFAFLGTPTGGNYQDTANFTGVWHLYIASTFDGGATWLTVDATPNDPVQRGSICTAGTTCGSDRNLLDFNDITIDKEGRVLVAYADGCIDSCVQSGPNSFSALATISRQSGGRRMFAAFDPVEPGLPAAPTVTGTRQSNGVYLSWTTPDNGGSTITGYEILRGTTPNGETHLITITGNTTHYLDVSADPNTTYYYKVKAINSVGEGGACGEAQVTAALSQPESPCVLPGITIVTDPAGDTNPAASVYTQQLDLLHVYTAEPFSSPSQTNTLAFTLKVGNLSTLPPSASWKALFNTANGTTHYVSMDTSAASTPTYSYGTVSGSPATETRLGPAAQGSSYSPDGTITIVITDTAVITNATPVGQVLSSVSGETQQTLVALLVTIDTTGSGSYTVHGNQYCAPDTAPIAQLSAMPQTGTQPLNVNFNGAASHDPDTGDTISSYIFDFGDGSNPITQTTATVTHVYTQAGNYPATLIVFDSHNKQSSNVAQAVIEVSGVITNTPTATGTILSTSTTTAVASATSGSSSATTTRTSIIPTVTPPIQLTPSTTQTAASTATVTPISTMTGTTAPSVTGVPSTYTATPTPISILGSPTSTPGTPSATSTGRPATYTATATNTTNPLASATPSSTTCPVQFQDVPVSSDPSSFYPYVRCLACQHILGGYSCGGTNPATGQAEPCGATGNPYFRPINNISRGQIAKIVSNSAGYNETISGQTYADVAPSDDPSSFYVYIERLTRRGIMQGYACGTADPRSGACDAQNRAYFRPANDATRGQLTKIVANTAGFTEAVNGQSFTDLPPSNDASSYYQYVERLSRRGVISGYPCGSTGEMCDSQNRPYFRPTAAVTRAQAAKIVSNTFFPGCATAARP